MFEGVECPALEAASQTELHGAEQLESVVAVFIGDGEGPVGQLGAEGDVPMVDVEDRQPTECLPNPDVVAEELAQFPGAVVGGGESGIG